MNDPKQTAPDDSTGAVGATGASWIPGATLLLVATIVGVASLALLCHAYGLNFQDEGWSKQVEGQSQVDSAEFSLSVAGMILATVLYWVGFLQLTRIGTPNQV